MRFATVSLLITALLGCAAPAVYADSKGDAEKSAKHWLELIDSGRYDKSWDDAASFFKQAESKNAWDANMKSQRAPLGHVVSRKTKESPKYETAISGVPNGQYYIFVYATDYDKVKNAMDMVTIGWDDKTKAWKGYGYRVISTPPKPRGK